jgi:hypothetical protein
MIHESRCPYKTALFFSPFRINTPLPVKGFLNDKVVFMGAAHRSELNTVEDQGFLCLKGFPKKVPRSTKEKVRYIYDIPMDEIATDVESCIGIPEGVIEGLSRN